jgi:hypothetical protein
MQRHRPGERSATRFNQTERMRRFVPVVLAVAAGTGIASAVAANAFITISVRDVVDANGARILSVAGTAGGAGAGEMVSLEARECGPGNAYRVIAGAETTAGGAYFVRTMALSSGSRYRVRWKDEVSQSVIQRYPLRPSFIEPRPRRVWRVHAIVRWPVLTGRVAILQRKTTSGAWLAIRRARFVRIGSTGPHGIDYAAGFRIPTRRLTVRVFLPAATGAPCYVAGVSDEWRS